MQRELAREKAELLKAVQAFNAAGELGEYVLAAFRADAQARNERIQALEANLAALPARRIVDADAARAIHAQLQHMEIADLLERHLDTGPLRRLLQATITAARITERVYSASHTGRAVRGR